MAINEHWILFLGLTIQYLHEKYILKEIKCYISISLKMHAWVFVGDVFYICLKWSWQASSHTSDNWYFLQLQIQKALYFKHNILVSQYYQYLQYSPVGRYRNINKLSCSFFILKDGFMHIMIKSVLTPKYGDLIIMNCFNCFWYVLIIHQNHHCCHHHHVHHHLHIIIISIITPVNQ